MHPLLLSLCAAAILALQGAPNDAAVEAWKAADTLKKKADYGAAAALFERFPSSYPESPRAVEALVEAGVCWFSAGRAAQVLHRMTPAARTGFDKALALFERVTTEHPELPLASRAQSMKGSTHLFAGELELAADAYGDVLARFPGDRYYFGKALERRAFVRRHLLDAQGAIEDLRRWQKEVNSPADTVKSVAAALELALSCGKPAPPLAPEQWLQGAPTTLTALHGEVIALYFFASWCTNCTRELPFVLDLQNRFVRRGVHFLGVVDHSKGQTPESLRAYLASSNIPYPVMLDNGQAAALYKAGALPYMVLIDRAGRIRWCDSPENLADATLEALLAEELKPAAPKAGK